ncbi:MAG: Crp/Fnr family transcriptional regulator [Eubacteriales bacterium]|jgi:CRP-like cAMP-binding protein
MFPVHHPIFRDITQEEFNEMTASGCIRTSEYEKDAFLFHMGDRTEEFGILLSGEIHIENIDLWGNRMILHNITAGQAFAETYAFCQVPVLVDVVAVQNCQVLFVHIGTLLSPRNQARSWYSKLLYNLLVLSTDKNLAWANRMLCVSSKGIRAKVMTYLSSEAVRRGSMKFSIPFDRQQMADYLNVERSALSKELGRMQREGILTFHKNQFHLHRVDHP